MKSNEVPFSVCHHLSPGLCPNFPRQSLQRLPTASSTFEWYVACDAWSHAVVPRDQNLGRVLLCWGMMLLHKQRDDWWGKTEFTLYRIRFQICNIYFFQMVWSNKFNTYIEVLPGEKAAAYKMSTTLTFCQLCWYIYLIVLTNVVNIYRALVGGKITAAYLLADILIHCMLCSNHNIQSNAPFTISLYKPFFSKISSTEASLFCHETRALYVIYLTGLNL